MSGKYKPSAGLVVFLAVVICLLAVTGLLGEAVRPLQLKFDAHCLTKFAHRISSSDRVVASEWTHSGTRKQLEVSLSGEELKRVIQAVTSAECARPPNGLAYANMYLITAKFFKGTNLLGEILIDDGELFRVGSREYRDVSLQPGTSSGGVLRDLLCAPVQKLVLEAEEKELGLR
jgi:hypothetical protein